MKDPNDPGKHGQDWKIRGPTFVLDRGLDLPSLRMFSFDDGRDEAPTSFLEVMKPIELCIMKYKQVLAPSSSGSSSSSGDNRTVLGNDMDQLANRLAVRKQQCLRDAKSFLALNGDDELSLDAIAALKLCCFEEIGLLMGAACAAQAFISGEEVLCDGEFVVQGASILAALRPFEPFLRLLLHTMQKLPCYDDGRESQLVFCNFSPPAGDYREFVHYAPIVASSEGRSFVTKKAGGAEAELTTFYLSQKQARDISKYTSWLAKTALMPPGSTFLSNNPPPLPRSPFGAMIDDLIMPRKAMPAPVHEVFSPYWMTSSLGKSQTSQEQFGTKLDSTLAKEDDLAKALQRLPPLPRELQDHMVIVLTPPSGRHFTVIIHPRSRVADLKCLARPKAGFLAGIAMKDIHVYYKDIELEDGNTVESELSKQEGFVLDEERGGAVKVLRIDTVAEIRLQRLLRFESNLSSKFAGEKYCKEDWQRLPVDVQQDHFVIVLTPLSGQHCAVLFKMGNTVGELKSMAIAKAPFLAGAAVEEIVLIYRDKELNDDIRLTNRLRLQNVITGRNTIGLGGDGEVNTMQIIRRKPS